MGSYMDNLAKVTSAPNPLIPPASTPPTDEQLAASIGCEPRAIIRSALNQAKTRLRQDGRAIYTSFVDEGDPENAAVYETTWPQ